MLFRIGSLILATLILAGCQNISKDDLQVLQARADKVDQLEQEYAQLKQEHASLKQSISQLNNQLEQEIKENQVLIEQNVQTGIIKVTMQQDIIFPSGSFEIDQEGAADILRKVVASLDGENKLRIVGHTDNLPVSKKWRNKFSDNWDLSARRAGEVARFLIWGTGFSPANIEVVGRAHVEPIADNTTEEGRVLNRRIELFIKK
ncbi:MAG: OmpA family protein [Ghiorsea sp.]|nr:OmpA family protein [Ghiorsea sp.]